MPHSAAHLYRIGEGVSSGIDTPVGAYRNMRHCAALRHCGTAALSDWLNLLSARVAGLSLSRRDPEQFHMDKGEGPHGLRLLARELRGGAVR